MESNVKLCMGCMNALDSDGTCHYCNYTDDAPYLQSYLAPKTVLDNRYIIGKMLSYNGEGASYICYDTVGKCKCVCREYMPDALCERESKTQNILVNSACLAKYKTYMSEFADINKVLSKMRNLNRISTAKDMFNENNTTYIILEYIEGVSLKKFLQTNTGFLSWEQVKKLFVPLFTTLNIVHNAGIIHRGISPDNIIVTTEGELKLTGFSISSIRTSNTGLIPEFSSGYTAPEQYSSLEWQGTWTDVYALAAVIYRILTGCVPLDGKTRMKNDTLVEASRLNPQIPAHVSRVLAKAMAVKGKDRIQTVGELVDELFRQNTAHIEHPKGATQTIPIQRQHSAPKKKPAPAPAPKKSSHLSLILGFGLLAIVLLVSVLLLIELFSSPDEESSSEYTVPSATAAAAAADSDEYFYSTTVATPETEASEDSSPYGYGSIMPKVTDMYYESVVEKLGNDFTIRPKYYYSDTDDRGYVKAQSIPEGTDYDPSKKVKLVLTVCAGPEYVPVPDFSGLTKKEYLSTLDSLNIKYKVVTTQSASVAADYVISTSTAVGTMINVKQGQVLTVTVSSGGGNKSTTAASSAVSNESKEEQVLQTQSSETSVSQSETAQSSEQTQQSSAQAQ